MSAHLLGYIESAQISSFIMGAAGINAVVSFRTENLQVAQFALSAFNAPSSEHFHPRTRH